MADSDKSNTDAASFQWSDFTIPLIILAIGLSGILLAAYLQDGAVLGLSILVVGFGAVGLAEGVLGLLFSWMPKGAGVFLILGLAALVYALYYGYVLIAAA